MDGGQQFIRVQLAQDAGTGFGGTWLSVAVAKKINYSQHLQ